MYKLYNMYFLQIEELQKENDKAALIVNDNEEVEDENDEADEEDQEDEDDNCHADEEVMEIPCEPQINSDIGRNQQVYLQEIPFTLHK